VLEHLYTQRPSPVSEAIYGTLMCLNDRIMDGFTWKGNLDGVYSVKVGYSWLLKWNVHKDEMGLWKWIWHLAAPEKFKFLYWTICRDVVPTM